MHKNYLISAIILCVLLSFQSCVKEIDTGKLPVEHKLVIYCMLTPDSLVSVRLSKSNSILANEADSIAGGKVELFENDNFLELLSYRGNGWYYSSKTYPRESYRYTIKASVAGFEDAEGTDSIPPRASILKSEKKSWVINDPDNQQEFADYSAYCTLSAGSGNYYELMFFTQSRQEIQGNDNSEYFISFIAGNILDADPCITSENYLNTNFSTFVFSDENLDRQKESIQVKMICEYRDASNYATALGSRWDEPGNTIDYTALRSVSKSYYQFRKSYFHYISNQDPFHNWDPSDPFSVLFSVSPSGLYTNVKNGYGIVASYQHSFVRTTLSK